MRVFRPWPGMKYAKPALSLDEQIDQLARRGMAIPNRDSAAHYLRHINYYRLRAYWLPYEIPAQIDGDHAFRPGTAFPHIIELYTFDRRLRLLVMDAIDRFEVSLRTRWAHVLATRHGPHCYLDVELFRRPREHEKCLERLRQEYGRGHETFVSHYKATYTDPALPPIWAAAELLTFGQLSLWFQNLKAGEDRVEIASAYGVDEQIVKSAAHHFTYIRNVCAHHSRLWNREMTIQMKQPKRPEWLGCAFHEAAPRRIYNTLVMLGHLLSIISPGSGWKAHVVELIHGHPHVDLAAMGFPRGWADLPLWSEGTA